MVRPAGRLLHAAVVAVGILEPQTHLGSVFLEVKKLFGVKGSTSLPVREGQGRAEGRLLPWRLEEQFVIYSFVS